MTTLRASIYEPGDNAFFSLLFEPKWTVNRRHEVCCQSFWHITREIALKKVTVMKLQYQQRCSGEAFR